MFHRPIPNPLVVAALVPRAEIGPQADLGEVVERDHADVRVAHQVHAEHLDAVIYRQQGKCVSKSFVSRDVRSG